MSLKIFTYELEKESCFSVFQFFILTYPNQQLQAQVIFSAFYTFKNSEISFYLLFEGALRWQREELFHKTKIKSEAG